MVCLTGMFTTNDCHRDLGIQVMHLACFHNRFQALIDLPSIDRLQSANRLIGAQR